MKPLITFTFLLCMLGSGFAAFSYYGHVSHASMSVSDPGPDTILKNQKMVLASYPCSDMKPLALHYRDSLNYQRNPESEAAAYYIPGNELIQMLNANDTLVVVLGRDNMKKTCIIMFPKDPAKDSRASGYQLVHQTFPAVAMMKNFDYNAFFSCQ